MFNVVLVKLLPASCDSPVYLITGREVCYCFMFEMLTNVSYILDTDMCL